MNEIRRFDSKPTFLGLLVLGVLAGCTAVATAQGLTHEFEHPPGVERWGELPPLERIAACQIPEAKLEAMDTAALVDACMRYPLRFGWAALDMSNAARQVDVVFQTANCLAELETRRDAGPLLFERYRELVAGVPAEKSGRMSEFRGTLLQASYLEMIMSRERISGSLSEADRVAMVSFSMAFRANRTGFTSLSQETHTYFVGRLMLRSDKSNRLFADAQHREIRDFLLDAKRFDRTFLPEVFELANAYVSMN